MSDDLESFALEVRQWLRNNAPKSLWGTSPSGPYDGFWGGSKHPEVSEDVLAWRDVAYERGWTAPAWPEDCGGGGLSNEQARVVHQEMQVLGVPRPVAGTGFTMIGPTLLEFGTEAQKTEHLPRICHGDVRWCQGYSEPNAGSDLASLQLKAVVDGDDYVLNGQKIWTSHADVSDWVFCLARTDPHAKRKQQGISFVLVDMKSEGLTTRRIDLISGYSPFCETFFDNVRVPIANRVGNENEGWTVGKALLQHERASIGKSIGRQRGSAQHEVVARAKKHLSVTEGRIYDAVLRDKIANLGMREAAFHLTLDRIAQSTKSGTRGLESSILKIVGTELKQDRLELGMEIAGEAGLGWEGPGFEQDDLEFTRDWLRSRASSIEGGSSEVQLNIISKRVLGLPENKP